jgi:6-pyruvoyltetrahydropterin/6-carboxytetrahydropterin synthase
LDDICCSIASPVRQAVAEAAMKVSVYRKAYFNAAHRLHVKSWSDEKNSEIFGLCNNPSYHGHNYELLVKVTGELDKVSGYVMDLKILKEIIEEEVVEKMDHRNLNLDVEEFRELNPTAENIAVTIWGLIRKKLPENLELKVILYETERNFVEYPSG